MRRVVAVIEQIYDIGGGIFVQYAVIADRAGGAMGVFAVGSGVDLLGCRF